jgi:hypothetical protein
LLEELLPDYFFSSTTSSIAGSAFSFFDDAPLVLEVVGYEPVLETFVNYCSLTGVLDLGCFLTSSLFAEAFLPAILCY